MLLAAAVMCGSLMATAQLKVVRDSVQLQEVEVLATRASSNTPVAFTNVSKQQIEAVKTFDLKKYINIQSDQKKIDEFVQGLDDM